MIIEQIFIIGYFASAAMTLFFTLLSVYGMLSRGYFKTTKSHAWGSYDVTLPTTKGDVLSELALGLFFMVVPICNTALVIFGFYQLIRDAKWRARFKAWCEQPTKNARKDL